MRAPIIRERPRAPKKKRSTFGKKALAFFNRPLVCVIGCALLLCILVAHLIIWNLPSTKEEPLPSVQVAQGNTFTLIPQGRETAQPESFADEQVYVETPTDEQPVATLGPLIGIDVSEHQGLIDWKAVADNGVRFAFVRVGARGYTDGSLILDPYFYFNIQEARAAGIKVGAYFYSQAINESEALEEADFVLKYLDGIVLDYPLAYDLETAPDENGRVNKLSGGQWTRNAQAFCERVEAAGYTPLLYGNRGDLLHYNSTLLNSYDVWFAQYDVLAPSAPVDFTIWQFTSRGNVAGIDGFVDLNIQSFNGDLASAGVVFHE
ncbi:MAG: glycoside hydrolase family 25 protein [Coriobacteriales bacterium]|nr:glycoside hydrolase family 25 protein [Coriobacteriales bacterium]